MKAIENAYLQEGYISQKISELLAIDYDENQLLVEEFSDCNVTRKGALLYVKQRSI